MNLERLKTEYFILNTSRQMFNDSLKLRKF